MTWRTDGQACSSRASNIWGHLKHQKCAYIGAHSDWSKFEMERSDWSCAYCRQGAPRYNPYYRSTVQILGLFLIDREQFHHQGRHVSSHIIAPKALFCGNVVARERYRSSVSTVLMGREPSCDLSIEATILFCCYVVLQ